MGRAPCCDKSKVKRGPWSPQEDEILKNYLHNHGTGGNWISLPLKAGLKRCGKSCRLRWLNYLRPDIKHGSFTPEEDNVIYNLYSKLGSRWSVIASKLPGRTDNDVKNHWNTKLKKKLQAKQESYLSSINQTTDQALISTPSVPRFEANNQGCSTIQGNDFGQDMPPLVDVLNYTESGHNQCSTSIGVDNSGYEFLMDFGHGLAYDQMMSYNGIWNNQDQMINVEEALHLPTNSYASSEVVGQTVTNQFCGNYY